MTTSKTETAEMLEDTSDNIKETKVSEALMIPLATGNRVYDKMFAGTGIRRTTLTLVTGRAGSGKTSWLQQLLNLMTLNPECIPIYNGLEQSPEQLKMVFDRLQLKEGFCLKEIAEFSVFLDFCKAKQAANPGKTLVVAIDSLQYLTVKGITNKIERQIHVVKALHKWARDTHAIVFLVGMVGKDGNYLGSGELEHHIDVWMELYTNVKRNTKQYGKRCMTARKNRHGDAGIDYPYTVGENGLKLLEEQKDEDEANGVSVVDKAKEFLKTADPMSILQGVAKAAGHVNQVFNAANRISKLFGGGKKKK
jgi:DNA repair protein RadA/Sms